MISLGNWEEEGKYNGNFVIVLKVSSDSIGRLEP
jgi:hypothetical protein